MLPKNKEETSKWAINKTASKGLNEKAGNYSNNSRSKSTDLNLKNLSLKLNDILSRRKKRRLKKKKEIFTFMYKYNDLVIEGLIKLCKGRQELGQKPSDKNIQGVDDTYDL